MRRFAPRIALTLVILFVVLVLAARHLLVPANRSFEYGDGIRLQLLSISHEDVDGQERVTWGVEVINGTDGPLDLSLSSTCRHAVPPLESGPSDLAERNGEEVSLSAGLATDVADSCPSPRSGSWWVYTLTLEDETGGVGSRTVTFTGRAH
ncbi:hypothetical protein GCM10007079_09060 [Nocardiopsis terrae]|uniref:Uncharacterized protein n=1 Tax=Nocardiopsis terrae TaxID=372655 RepID=A0ABR9HCV7_9ACTN|nr:hypothetical protein [Nocardiopsis terrae]MBE1456878.1 hypothetical protein [Nocardiopsis terrae]GHC74651.1 hypothetical protein GCM10007079_09060 [Nocardiopsis terrae]